MFRKRIQDTGYVISAYTTPQTFVIDQAFVVTQSHTQRILDAHRRTQHATDIPISPFNVRRSNHRRHPSPPSPSPPLSISISTGQATFRLRGSNGSQCFRVNPLWTCSYTASDTCDARRISPPQFAHFISGNLLPHTHVPLPSIPACMSVRIPCTRGPHTCPNHRRPYPVGSGVQSVSQVRPASTQDHTSC